MQATLDSTALKPFTRALTCLSKYGEELSIHATPGHLSLSATNSSKSAYCRFKYDMQFFSRYRVGASRSQSDQTNAEQAESITCQLLTKSLLSILKHRTVEKAVERCELTVIEGMNAEKDDESNGDDQDGLESKLIVRLHCKHGVIKTHRLLLQTQTSLLAPGVPDHLNESRLTIGPKALKDMIDHFQVSKGVKSDPQLIWSFGEVEVGLKSSESSIDSRGKGQLSTELTISADEFDAYDVFSTPTTIAFHLREFNATIAFADSMSLPLELRFTDPAAPLFIEIEGDFSETLFVISTSQVQNAPSNITQNNAQEIIRKKRERETTEDTPKIKKPMKVVHSTARGDGINPEENFANSSRASSLMPPPSSIPLPRTIVGRKPVTPRMTSPSDLSTLPKSPQPLFLPSSQLSAADEAVLRATGLGVEEMDADELTAMLEGEGEEVAFDFASQGAVFNQDQQDLCNNNGDATDPDSFELVEDMGLAATQTPVENPKTFQPLFED